MEVYNLLENNTISWEETRLFLLLEPGFPRVGTVMYVLSCVWDCIAQYETHTYCTCADVRKHRYRSYGCNAGVVHFSCIYPSDPCLACQKIKLQNGLNAIELF